MKRIDPKKYHPAIKKLRQFFEDKGFIEVPTQPRLSILAACEDPSTIADFAYTGETWPLPQTGQMHLEYELLTVPDVPGYFCQTTSYRLEKNPIEGRHDLIFPMFEFETHGDMTVLRDLEVDLLKFLGFDTPYPIVDYDTMAGKYGVKELEMEHETKMGQELGPAVFLRNFPQYTSPFWNMRKTGDHANKIDVILFGIETIGSAERSTDVDEMRKLFHTISDGEYANLLYNQFGKRRVENELEEFLSLVTANPLVRCGGGIGMTRFIRALDLLEELNGKGDRRT